MRTGARIAVVGGGIFGVTTSLHLDRAGHDVVLFERNVDLLLGASNTNQRRLHRGYHYPRSDDTARSALESVASFAAEYPESIVTSYQRFVGIAKYDSLVGADAFLRFLDRMGLEYVEDYPTFLRREAVDISLRIQECSIDIDRLRTLCWQKLRSSRVEVRLRSSFEMRESDDFDHVVLAAYSRLNYLEAEVPNCAINYQFEVCEKPVIKLPAAYRDTSLIILDGPFLCIDPIVDTDTFLAGNVVHAIHATTVGLLPLIPKPLLGLLDSGLHPHPPVTKFPSFEASAEKFLIGFDEAEHVGSLFTVRAVLPDVEDTDARPTLVRQLSDCVTSVFSGKISTCIDAARQVVEIVDKQAATMRRVDSA